ncbi:MAG: helix-turn-helix domain-containing protein [Mesorhizobium sp.]
MKPETSLRSIFATNLRRIRKERGISQEDLAKQARLSRAYMSTLEHGLKSPTLDTVESLAKALRIAPEELVRSPKGSD